MELDDGSSREQVLQDEVIRIETGPLTGVNMNDTMGGGGTEMTGPLLPVVMDENSSNQGRNTMMEHANDGGGRISILYKTDEGVVKSAIDRGTEVTGPLNQIVVDIDDDDQGKSTTMEHTADSGLEVVGVNNLMILCPRTYGKGAIG